jgi:hypothetical protein
MMNDLTRKKPKDPTVRQSFVAKLVGDHASAWSDHGKAALDALAKEDPKAFVDSCSRFVPKDVALTDQQHNGWLDPADQAILREILLAIKASDLDANNRPPGEVLAFVLEAIRLHMARPIEEQGK